MESSSCRPFIQPICCAIRPTKSWSGKISRKSSKSCAVKTLRIVSFVVLLAAAVSVLAQTKDASGPHVDLITIDGSINPAVDDFIRESIGRAKAGDARALIIQLDTAGGLLSSTLTLAQELLGTPVPVMVYVAPSGAGAGSAGVFITMAANIAAMAPGTNIGAAHPVAGGGQEEIGRASCRERVEMSGVGGASNRKRRGEVTRESE